MRLDRPAGGHLTYCTNIHPGETWPEVRAALTEHVPAVRDALGHRGAFGVGLRLSARAAADLADPAAFDELRALLAERELYAFTLNGFPYGPFHGRRVKTGVYDPDWRTPERLAYSNRLARQLAALLPDGLDGSVSTVPGGFKANAATQDDLDRMVDGLAAHAAELVRIEAATGRTVRLALEPEPECFLETTDQAVRFLEDRVFAKAGRDRLAAHGGPAGHDAEAALRRHIGVCFDVCHAAVEYEDVADALGSLRATGIAVPKVQLSAALRIPALDGAAAARLRDFDDGVYLHQVVSRAGDGRLTRYLDLPDALAAYARGAEAGREWRVHFHVPVFLEQLDGVASTQPDLVRALAWLAGSDPGDVPHLEVETYTWGVLPARHRGRGVAQAIARELAWTRERLAA